MSSIIVRKLNVMRDSEWSFRNSVPCWRHGKHGTAATFDPFPAYPHDLQVVRAAADYVAECCPPAWDVELYVADREEVGRSNGFSNVHEDSHYDGDEWVKDPPVGLIMLSGKRVPPHPAVTRYLVAHEYGHNVEWMINAARGAKHAHDEQLAKDYMQMRGLGQESLHHGSGGRWHNGVHEIFACDFRLVVCGVEPDYWPHPGVPRPEDVPAVKAWWSEALASLSANERAA